jgi:predicted RND superfamily exporter protein
LSAAENLWRDGTTIQAAKVSFKLNVDKNGAAATLLEQRDLWNRFVEQRNLLATVTANRAYHTAQAWVRAEAEEAVVASTINTIIVSAVCAWLGMFIFTQDPMLACIVVCLVLGIVCGLAFFIVVMMSWKIGSIEVISLVIFVGYSVTYSLHIAHSYAEAQMPADEGSPLAFEQDVESPFPDSPDHRKEYLQRCRNYRTKVA